MAIDAYDIYQDFCAEANTFQGGFIPPETVFTRYLNIISKDLWVEGCNNSEKSQEWRDRMMPFLVSKNIITQRGMSYYSICDIKKDCQDYARLFKASIITVGQNDVVTIPSTEVDGGKCYDGKKKELISVTKPKISQSEYLNSIKEVEIDNIDLQRWDSCLNHVFADKRPSLSAPKMVQVDGVFRVAPRDVSVVVLYYYKLPKEATFLYTRAAPNLQTGAGGQIIYNKSGSQPLEWSAEMKNEFLIRLGEKYGVYTRDQFISQHSTHKMKEK
jgi:hypothetical protein